MTSQPDLQIRVQKALDDMVAQGHEKGIQATVYWRGQLAVDAFAGVANDSGQAVTGETLFPVFSTTKGIAATAIHLLVERGKFDYDTPIASIWPEFGAHGKGGITVRHALNHTSGLPYIPLGLDLDAMHDWDTMCAALADATPVSAPGERIEYHAITYGWILGELVRRVDGRDFSTFMHQELCDPLGITTMFCGLPAELEPSVAILEEPGFQPVEVPAEPTPQSIPQWVQPLGAWMNRSDARRTCLPASGGIMNAHAIARHYAALLPGGVDGVELLPPSRIRLACQPAFTSDGEHPERGLGYGVSPALRSEAMTTFGHGGHGGSVGLGNFEEGWSFGFTRNRFGEFASMQAILDILREHLPIAA